jgi:hypothetical protein
MTILQYEGRTSLLERYRIAFEKANGYPVDAVMYRNGRYEVHAQTTKTKMKRKEFREALETLIERAKEKEDASG